MPKIFFILLLFLILFSKLSDASVRKVLAIHSIKIRPYQEALDGFKDIYHWPVEELILSDSNESAHTKTIYNIYPDLILAIGLDALSLTKNIKDIPVIYLMVSNPENILSAENNITGVSMNISPEKQLEIFREILPHLKKIGLLFDKNKSGFFVQKAQVAAHKLGIDLITRHVSNPKEIPSLMRNMKTQDAFWMIPDTTVICPETVEFFLLSSIEYKIPIFTFSDKYVEMGALLSLSIDAFDLGRQAGEVAQKILSGADVKTIPKLEAMQSVIFINLKVAKKLGITIDKRTIDKAKIIR